MNSFFFFRRLHSLCYEDPLYGGLKIIAMPIDKKMKLRYNFVFILSSAN